MENFIFCAMVNIAFHIIVMVLVKPRSSRAEVFWKILQNSQENTFARVSFQ